MTQSLPPQGAMEFGRYLLRELLWELDKFEVSVPGLTDALQDQIEVLSYSGYDAIRLRAISAVFDARLDWSGQTPPVVLCMKDPAP